MSAKQPPDDDAEATAAAVDLEPPPHLEGRIVERLRANGLLRSGRPRTRPWLAAAALFVLGTSLGAWWRTPTKEVPPASRFLLLLYPGQATPQSLVDRDVSARDHGAWVAALRKRGRAVSGERLAPGADAAVGFEGSTAPEPAPQGFFVVGAPTLADAVELARESPHVQGGGRIVVRTIDTPSRR